MNEAFTALSEPRRRAILEVIGPNELSVGEIAGRFSVTRPAISQHLAVLRAAGLVTERREGTRRLYRTRPDGAAELRAWLDGFWRTSLDRLQSAAEADHQSEQETEQGSTR